MIFEKLTPILKKLGSCTFKKKKIILGTANPPISIWNFKVDAGWTLTSGLFWVIILVPMNSFGGVVIKFFPQLLVACHY